MNEIARIPQRDEALPHSIEAEQQFLGAILEDASRLDRLGKLSSAELFYDPLHALIFDTIRDKHKRGEMVSPITLALWADEHLQDLSGRRYLVQLYAASIGGSMCMHYVKLLREMGSKRAILVAMREAAVRLQDETETAAEVAARLGMTLVERGDSDSGPVSMMRAATMALESAVGAYQGLETSVVPSFIGPLDKRIGGFYPGELILLGGRPSMGKSALALGIALNVARAGKGVAIASLEMTPDALAVRALSEQASDLRNAVAYSSIRRGQINDAQMQTLAEASRMVGELPIQILPSSFRDLGALYAGARHAKSLLGEKCGLKLLIVDYLQLLRAEGRSRFEQITEISIALKALAVQLNVPVIALSQLSRSLEQRDDKRPMLSDLRESGQLEQDADTVLFCYRDEYYLERDQPAEGSDADKIMAWQNKMERAKNRLEIIVAKQRQGEVGTAHVRYNPAFNLIWSDHG